MTSGSSAARWFSTALSHHQAGRLKEAEALYRRVLEHDARHADSAHYLGLIASETGRHKEGIELLKRAVIISPLASHFQANLAEALRRCGEIDEAIDFARRALQLDAKFPENHYILAVALLDAGQDKEAALGFARTIQLDPHHYRAFNNLGNALSRLGKMKESLESYARGAALAPNSAELYSNWALTLIEAGQQREALEKARRAVELAPDDPTALCNLGRCAGNWFNLDDAIARFRRALALKPRYALAHSNLLFVMLHHPGLKDEELLQTHADWGAQHAPAVESPRVHVRDRAAGRPLRIGYVSPDFREHPVTYFIEPVIANHGPDVEVFLYSNSPPAEHDVVTERLKAYGHQWRDVRGLTNPKLARLIDEHDRIDVLIDLAGHTAGHRLQVFGGKPAPVQVTYLGYQATTGVRAIDYRLTDALVDPPGVTDPYHTERLERMDVFACYRPPTALEPVAPERIAPAPCTRNGFFTFGCYTKIEKISEQSLDLWAAALKLVEDSKLIVFASAFDEPQIVELLLKHLESRGVHRSRVTAVGRQPLGLYLRSHERVDVILDTVPFNGHTTTCHALWMGVPTITLAGTRYASRMGLAVMTHIGLSEFVATTPQQFVEIAATMASQPQRLAEIRAGMRDRMKSSVMMDEVRFTRRLESLYRELWNRWSEQNPADQSGSDRPAERGEGGASCVGEQRVG